MNETKQDEYRRDVPPGIEETATPPTNGKIPLLRAIAAVQAEMPTLRKTETANVGKYKYKYIPLTDIWAALRPILTKHGLAVTNMTEGGNLKTCVWHVETGECISSDHPVDTKLQPQAFGSALTYARRYNLNSLFQIVADEDDDAAAAMRPANDEMQF